MRRTLKLLGSNQRVLLPVPHRERRARRQDCPDKRTKGECPRRRCRDGASGLHLLLEQVGAASVGADLEYQHDHKARDRADSPGE